MSHKKSKRVFWCHTIQSYIFPSHCQSCDEAYEDEYGCPRGNYFNDCREIIDKNRLTKIGCRCIIKP